MQVLSLDTSVGSILIPVAMVAQIVGRDEQKFQKHNLPFIRNQIQWREYNMPLVFGSEMLGAAAGSDDGFLRSVILWPMKGCKNTELFALTSLESPKVLELDDETTSAQASAEDSPDNLANTVYALGFVQLKEKIGIIPNLKYLAETIF